MHRICRGLVRLWFALSFHKIRLLRARDVTEAGPTLFAVSHPARFLDALILTAAGEGPTRCLVPKKLVGNPLARFLAGNLGMILTDHEGLPTGKELRAAMEVLAKGETLVVFADQSPALQAMTGAMASTAASLVGQAELQLAARRVTVHPVYVLLPASSSPSREFLIYIDSALARPAAGQADDTAPSIAAALEARFRENAFRLRPGDLDYFLADLEKVMRARMEEDWSSRPNWKQDAEGFVLNRLVADWVRQTNYLDPGRLVALRESLDDYRRLQRQCALHRLQVEPANSWVHSRLRRALVLLETLAGLPIALYGLLNHLLIGALAFLAGSFGKNDSRDRTTEWTIRGAIVLAGYAAQVYLVAHRWGRAAGGYYAPTLPATGLYLWRYAWVLEHRTRLLFVSLTIPATTRRAKRLRDTLLEELDKALAGYEAEANVPG
jgi:hypothetical protein